MHEYDLTNATTTGLGKVKSDSPISTELMRIDGVIEVLSKKVDGLRSRISPSLNPVPKNERGSGETHSGGSELYANLALKRHQLEQLSDEISAITSECEL